MTTQNAWPFQLPKKKGACMIDATSSIKAARSGSLDPDGRDAIAGAKVKFVLGNHATVDLHLPQH